MTIGVVATTVAAISVAVVISTMRSVIIGRGRNRCRGSISSSSSIVGSSSHSRKIILIVFSLWILSIGVIVMRCFH